VGNVEVGAADKLAAGRAVREDVADSYFGLAAEEVGMFAGLFYAVHPSLCTSLVRIQCFVKRKRNRLRPHG
jgi:hypothetical protein